MSELFAGHRFDAFLNSSEQDILQELLRDKRSPNTRRAYERDLRDFFWVITRSEPTPALVADFLKLERPTAIALVLKYKAHLIDRGLAEATINRRLSALRSLASFAARIGRCQWSLDEIEGERLVQYRDTAGVDAATYGRILQQCDRRTVAGKRNYAILRLLWDNVLRRSEVSKANVGDFDASTRSLFILGKGKGTQKERIELSQVTAEAIAQWLATRAAARPDAPLFVTLDNATHGRRLSGNALYELVSRLAAAAGIAKRLSPHRVRHSGITAALDLTGGDVRRVKKLSRHAKTDTLLLYDDNRRNHQATISNLLADALPGPTSNAIDSVDQQPPPVDLLLISLDQQAEAKRSKV